MRGIAFNVFSRVLADRTRVGLFGVGGAYQFAPFGDGVCSLQYEGDYWTYGHDGDQAAVNGTLFVNAIEVLGFERGKPLLLWRQTP